MKKQVIDISKDAEMEELKLLRNQYSNLEGKLNSIEESLRLLTNRILETDEKIKSLKRESSKKKRKKKRKRGSKSRKKEKGLVNLVKELDFDILKLAETVILLKDLFGEKEKKSVPLLNSFNIFKGK
ncbi:hypothetical protein [Bacillus pinisoli]|uniref:hypothetical protein n=1 Tax=Bacillus pinisoli TaxID=2901866 RepID=UPI001FF63899|nr:hypothetical protein [Bacillus pinisoli]